MSMARHLLSYATQRRALKSRCALNRRLATFLWTNLVGDSYGRLEKKDSKTSFKRRRPYEQKLVEERQKAASAHAQQLSLVAALFDSTINPAFEEVRSELLKHGSEPNIVLAHPSATAVPDWPVQLRSTGG